MPQNRPTDLRERVFEFSCATVLFSLELSKSSGVVREFAAKNSISLKDMHETLYWLRVIRRCKLAPDETVQPLLVEANELTSMLTAGMKRLHPVGLTILVIAVSVLVLSLTSKF